MYICVSDLEVFCIFGVLGNCIGGAWRKLECGKECEPSRQFIFVDRDVSKSALRV
jgi:hypothetical protein